MLSIIICSRTQTLNKDLSENIENTVGSEHELIVVDNSENGYSIFEAYNLGIERSKGDFLCFIHDDILFYTNGWGNTIQYIFSLEEQIGLIGIAGTKTKTRMPSTWWDCPEDQKVMNIIQHFSNGEIKKQQFGFGNASLQAVVAIDGVFMAMRKDNRIRFSNDMEGFHNYDLNISFEYIKNGYKIMVTNEILIEHFSIGSLDEAWVVSGYKIHNLYKDFLPVAIKVNMGDKKTEGINAIRFIDKCLTYKQNKKAFSTWKAFFLIHPISVYHYTFFKRIIKNYLC